MKKQFFLGIGLVFLLVGLAHGRTIHVDAKGEGDYKTIEEAVEAASDGDTLRVAEGTYHAMVELNKQLTLLGAGAGKTIVESGGQVFRAIAEGCIIEGFTLRGNFFDRVMGVTLIVEAKEFTLTHNVFDGGHESICVWIDPGASATIHYNQFLVGAIRIAVNQGDASHPVDARWNYWGTENEEEIQRRIGDGKKKSGCAVVNYSSWLSRSEKDVIFSTETDKDKKGGAR